ncbi:MAG: hypothetical protein SGCHY_005559 [Lobulomycetales sp.]
MMGASKYGSVASGFGNGSQGDSGGAGFMYPSASQGSGLGSQGGGNNNKIKGEKSLRPLTCKQFANAVLNQSDEVFSIDSADLSLICLVGRVSSMQKTSTLTKFIIDDSTAEIEVTKWVDKDEQEDAVQPMDAISEGDYVRVIGNPREFKGKKNVQGTLVQRLEDPNIIAYHYLDCVKCHLELTRGRAGGPAAGHQAPQGVPAFGAQGFNRDTATSNFAPTGNRLDDSIRNFCESAGDGATININAIVKHCRTIASEQEIKGRVKFLADEGFLYSTTDENSYQVC